jgi:chemotaxis protein MotB
MEEKENEGFEKKIESSKNKNDRHTKEDGIKRDIRKVGEKSIQKRFSFDPILDLGDFYETKTEDPQYGSSVHWSVPWSDLMMTMFVMFAVLFSSLLNEKDVLEAFQPEVGSEVKTTLMKPKRGLSFGEFELTPDKLFEISKQAVQEARLEDVTVILEEDKTVRVSIRGPLLFDLGQAELRTETQDFLKKIALVLGKTNNEIHVVGHTDNFPISNALFQTNWELSVIRASRVARYLIEADNLEPGRFSILGHSMYRPVAPNNTEKNKQKNRRVEIIITRDNYTGNSTR